MISTYDRQKIIFFGQYIGGLLSPPLQPNRSYPVDLGASLLSLRLSVPL